LTRQRGELVTGHKPTVPTFGEAVEKVIAMHRTGWKDGGRSEKLWRATLRAHAMLRLGRRPVDRIHTSDVMEVLLPIWNEKRATARQVRHRIGAVMRWAVAQGYLEDNPAGDAIGAALPRTRSGRRTTGRSPTRRLQGPSPRCAGPGPIRRRYWRSSSSS